MFKLFVLLWLWTGKTFAHGLPPSWEERIVGGVEIDIEEAPYQVGIYKEYPLFLATFICGGSIISEFHVLTAAHCHRKSDDHVKYYVKAGSREVASGGQLLEVEETFVHPEFDVITIKMDFMILKLASGFEFNEQVQPIQLPSSTTMDIPEPALLVVSGWGRTQFMGNISEILKSVEVPLRDPEVCLKAYREVHIDIDTSAIICAGVEGKDACQGDSGGPLTYRDPDSESNTLVGVVSLGEDCGNKQYPGVYAKVAKVLDWIQEITGL